MPNQTPFESVDEEIERICFEIDCSESETKRVERQIKNFLHQELLLAEKRGFDEGMKRFVSKLRGDFIDKFTNTHFEDVQDIISERLVKELFPTSENK